MNIFEIFTYGNGRHTETNLTSILAFLLDPQESHGYGTSFINEFLLPIEQEVKKIINHQKIRFDDISLQLKDTHLSFFVQTEQRFVSEYIRQRILDIVITLQDQYGNDILLIGIENKINQAASIDENQLTDEFKQLLNSKDEDTPLIFIYLTPKPINKNSDFLWKNLVNYSDSIQSKIHSIHNYSWGAPSGLSDEINSQTIKRISYNLLQKERNAEINPASSHADLLIRSLIRHIDSTIVPKIRSNSLDRDNLMEINLETEDFWEKDWGNRSASMSYAKKYRDYFNAVISEYILTNNSHDLYLINKSSKVRYSAYISKTSTLDFTKKIIKGRIYRIRSDGGTNTKRIEILLTYSKELLVDELIYEIPPGLSLILRDGEICLQIQTSETIPEVTKNYLRKLMTEFSIPLAIQDLTES